MSGDGYIRRREQAAVGVTCNSFDGALDFGWVLNGDCDRLHPN